MPLLKFDLSIIERSGTAYLIGVDEAGRGPMAGPVTAAAAFIPPAAYPFLTEVNDSKKLSEKKRETLLVRMRASGVRFGFGFASPREIDEVNILNATFRAMSRASVRLASALGAGPSDILLLVDGPHRIRNFSFRQEAVVKGDGKSLSIAAASIFAKVVRDRWMMELDRRWPGYGFAIHKGYGTKDHMSSLDSLGPCPEHRLSFAPVRKSMTVIRSA
ncbi:MAG: ribonuclease HII [Elusimicrobia bacterium RIFOXYA12_FULL_51_18]|nr:MAG: ribonuclease HII [Elusimicrobia bacterium RIFOXYA12_FULL_51_18]OGS28779.1 MAG: ribonuclease HII [Elusimicrobia bacterium RIFOXYA2_FULL_53_38]